MLAMIERFLKLRNCINESLRSVLSEEAVSTEEWEQLSSMCKALKPVEMVLKTICSENSNLLKAEDSMEFLLQKLETQKESLLSELRRNLCDCYVSRRNVRAISLMMFLCNPTVFKQKTGRSFVLSYKKDLLKYAKLINE